ncbi:hypothetical protein CVT26_001822 [Gymnopilus dilepis]|uniref:F-box domain-containing protein n=1 Tax=Gymnopilus dilepis TaxID=231916 RepID=A0A409VRN7_9AGAR|nr:hypothetical protein CVT26_001822 [Gymnopilus dilepis]
MTITPPARRFPLAQELVDMVLQDVVTAGVPKYKANILEEPGLAEVRKTLLACTLVNRPFRCGAQRFLFSHIVVHDELRKLNSIHSALHSFPHLWLYIRTIKLCFSSPVRLSLRLHGVMDMLVKHPAINIRQLIIRGDPLQSKEDPTSFAGLSMDLRQSIFVLDTSPSLSSLHLQDLWIPSFLLAQFPNLRTLVLERCSISSTRINEIDKHAFDSVENLHLIQCTNFFPLDFLNCAVPRDADGRGWTKAWCNIKSLTYDFNRDTYCGLDHNALTRFIECTGVANSIESLEL